MRETGEIRKGGEREVQAQATTEERNGALHAIAAGPAGASAGHRGGHTAAGFIEAAERPAKPPPRRCSDKLMLDGSRVFAMADALEEWRRCPDPLGVVSLESTLYNGIRASARCRCPSAWWPAHGLHEARPKRGAAERCRGRPRHEVRRRVRHCGAACAAGPAPTGGHRSAMLAAAADGSMGLPEAPSARCARHRSGGPLSDAHADLHDLVRCSSPAAARGLSLSLRGGMPKCRSSETRHGQLPRETRCVPPADPAMARDIIKERESCRRYGVVQRRRDPSGGLLAVGRRRRAAAHSRGHEGGPACSSRRCARARHRRRVAGLSRWPATAHRSSCSPTRPTGRPSIWGPRLAVKCVEEVAGGHRPREPLRLTKHSEAIVALRRRRPGTPSSPRWTRRRCAPTPPRCLTDGGQFGLGAEIRHLHPRRSTPAGPLPPTRSPLTSTCCAARAG
ncbi:MAG: hypothetical protein ACLTDR_07490 [Adlercreutzia equolifaciens]